MKKGSIVLAVMLMIALMLSGQVFTAGAAGSRYDAVSITVDEDYDWDRLADQDITLNVYNWGEYISTGVDGESLDVNAEFEALTGIKVHYTTFDTNEAMYAKLKSGGASYDVVIPSDYMIGKMIAEDMLEPLNFANIPNYSLIGEEYKDMPYDPENKYSVPYMWGLVGIIYNTTMVDEEVDSWSFLWNEKYEGNILMFDNSRDAMGLALLMMGKSLNPATEADIDAAAEALMEQKPLVQAYVMDQIFDKMGGGEAALAPYYAGDAITMIAENPDLAFAVPKEGTNYFVDAMCIPKGSPNKEAAEIYINFMCEKEVSMANSEFIGYSTPQVEAEAALPEEMRNNPIAYPSDEVMANTEPYTVLSEELNAHMDKAWSDMRGGTSEGNGWIIPVALAVAVLLIILLVLRGQSKKKKKTYR